MSNYSPITNFAALDALASGNPSKAAKGATITAELNAIAVAIATKYDAPSLAAAAQILFGNGAANAPSIAFNAYPNTGLYAAAANSLGFAANGVVAGTISSNGAWTIAAPVANNTALTINTPSTSGQSFGLTVNGGTTAADWSVLFRNQAGQNIFQVRGDGVALITDSVGGTFFQVGYLDEPQHSITVSTSLALTDRGKQILMSTNTGNTVTIPANATVAFPIGSIIRLINMAPGNWTLAIGGADILTWLPNNVSGSRTLAAASSCTIEKITATQWIVTGVGLS